MELNFRRLLACLAEIGLLGLVCSTALGQGELLLKSGFEEGVRVTDDMLRITGIDRDTGFNWDATPAWIDSAHFVYSVRKEKRLSDYMASSIETMAGPHGNLTRVLRMENKATDPDIAPTTSRNEYSIYMKAPPEEYREGYVKYWMKLQGNLAELLPNDQPTSWYMIMEWKEPDSGVRKSAEDCKAIGEAAAGSNNYRINIGLVRRKDDTRFRWHIIAEHPQPCREVEWEYLNPNMDVPLGRWFLVEGYMKKDATAGRVYFAVNGEVVLDTDVTKPDGFTGRTEHADHPLPLQFWSPMKNYHGMSWNSQGPISQWYDDIELWSGFPPGHPALRKAAQNKPAKASASSEKPDKEPLPHPLVGQKFVPQDVDWEHLVYQTTFADPAVLRDWRLEGGRSMHVTNGKLVLESAPGSTQSEENTNHLVAWLTREVPGDFLLEFGVRPENRKQGLNIVFFNTRGVHGEDIFSPALQPRDGLFKGYTNGDLNCYHISYWAGTRGTANIRKNPGFHLVSVGRDLVVDAPAAAFQNVRVYKRAGAIRLMVGDVVAAAYDDDGQTYGPVWNHSGWIGLRQMAHTVRCEYNHVEVFPLNPVPDDGRQPRSP